MACRQRRDKATLVRIVRRPDGSVVMDDTAALDGRGAYLCADPDCWANAIKGHAIERALKTPLPIELKTRLEHGDIAAVRIATDRGAPTSMTGGTHGT